MKKRISSVDPLQLGKVLAVIYGCISLIVVPFLLIAAVLGISQNSGGATGGAILLIIFIPVLYSVVGFVGGLIVALIYNLVAGWTGGIEFTLTDVGPGLPSPNQPGRIPR